jgi:protein-L-isoaspartate(D-aspartate) O-methyltransferase
MKLRNIRLRHGDGYAGWPENAPFDGILVTAAPPEIPAALIEQLAVGGRLVVPVGTDQAQLLKVIDRTDDGLVETILEAVHFVPLVNGTAKQ